MDKHWSNDFDIFARFLYVVIACTVSLAGSVTCVWLLWLLVQGMRYTI